MPEIPNEIRQEVIATLYKRFDAMRWEEMGPNDTSGAYSRFVDDPNIGGKLAVHMPANQVRVWIKDGPAKEYRRALQGVGPYARHTSRRYPSPQAVVESALGTGWTLREGSLENKPMRCWADNDEEHCYIIWGSIQSLKELIWHAALHSASESPDDAIVVLTRPGLAPISGHAWDQARALCDVVGVALCQVTHMIGKK